MRFYYFIHIAVFSLVVMRVAAFSPTPPHEQIINSPSGRYQLKVVPPKLEAIRDFDDLLSGDFAALYDRHEKLERANLVCWLILSELKEDSGSVVIWERPATTPVAPIEAFVTDGGGVLTISSWPYNGASSVALSVYQYSGNLVYSCLIEKLFSPAEVMEAEKNSVRRWWGSPEVLKVPKESLNDVFSIGGVTYDIAFAIPVASELKLPLQLDRTLCIITSGPNAGKITLKPHAKRTPRDSSHREHRTGPTAGSQRAAKRRHT